MRHHQRGKKGSSERKSQNTGRKRSVLRWIGYVVFGVAYIYVSTSLWIFQGPFPALKSYLIDSLDATRHGYLLRPISLYTVSEAVIKKHALSNTQVSVTTPVKDIITEDYSMKTDPKIDEHIVHGKTYTAYILLIHDPKRIKVVATKYLHQRGETVQEMVKDANAVAGINAGGFDDNHWQGTGAYPQGITMTDGKLVSITGSKTSPQPVIAFTKNGQMIAGDYSLPQLKSLNVTQAVSFGPVLVDHGKAVQTTNGYDLNPRTAIGQAQDGTVILIVTDGRYINGANDAGASYNDIKDLMLQYNARIAANLDGGSSSTMAYNGKLLNKPVDILGERSVATSIVVTPPLGGSSNG